MILAEGFEGKIMKTSDVGDTVGNPAHRAHGDKGRSEPPHLHPRRGHGEGIDGLHEEQQRAPAGIGVHACAGEPE